MPIYSWNCKIKCIFQGDETDKEYCVNRWPVPAGFHIPRHWNMTCIKNIWIALWARTSSQWNCFKKYLKMPSAWMFNGCTTNKVSTACATFWFANYSTASCKWWMAYISDSAINIWYTWSGSHSNKYWMQIRPFYDYEIAPDSTWTTLFDWSNVAPWAGIFHKESEWLITMSSDWKTWCTIADRNLWATTVWNEWDSVNANNAGCYYQRWNNYGFSYNWPANKCSAQVDASNYWPWNWYFCDVFRCWANPRDSSNNGNLWGYTSYVSTPIGNVKVGYAWNEVIFQRPVDIEYLVVWWGGSGGRSRYSAWGGGWAWQVKFWTRRVCEWDYYWVIIWAGGKADVNGGVHNWYDTSFWDITAIWWWGGWPWYCWSWNNGWDGWSGWGSGSNMQWGSAVDQTRWKNGAKGCGCGMWWWGGWYCLAWNTNGCWWCWYYSNMNWAWCWYGSWGSGGWYSTWICGGWASDNSATRYWSWGWWGSCTWSTSRCNAWWDGCQWIVLVRYPKHSKAEITWGCKYLCGAYCYHCFTSNWEFIVKWKSDSLVTTPWIYYSEKARAISFSKDWTSWYTMADRNLWATTNDTTNEWSYGCYYQWWNNYWFNRSERGCYTTAQRDVSSYWPSSYCCNKFVGGSNIQDWATTANNDLWGRVTFTFPAMRWPSLEWWHIGTPSDFSCVAGTYCCLSWSVITYDALKDYYKIPRNWYIWACNRNECHMGDYIRLWTGYNYWDGCAYYYAYQSCLQSSNYLSWKSCLFGIRPFRNTALVPDNTRCKLL